MMNSSKPFTNERNNTANNSLQNSSLLDNQTIILFSTLNIFVFIVGVTGNCLTLFVLATKRAMRRSVHLYTFNLCISDLLVLLFFVPTRVVLLINDLNWTQGLHICRVSYIVIPTSIVTTIATLLSISIDRARGLLRPFEWRSDSRKTAKILIPVIWTISIVMNVPFFIIPVVEKIAENRYLCKEVWFSENFRSFYWFCSFALTYVIPLLIIFVIQLLHVYTIKFKVKNKKFVQQNKKMLNMTVAIVLVFALCTGFDHVLFLMNYFQIKLETKMFFDLYCTSSFMMVAQAAINPFIYGKFRGDFYRGYKSIFMKLFPAKEKDNGSSNELQLAVTPQSTQSLNSEFVKKNSEMKITLGQVPDLLATTYCKAKRNILAEPNVGKGYKNTEKDIDRFAESRQSGERKRLIDIAHQELLMYKKHNDTTNKYRTRTSQENCVRETIV